MADSANGLVKTRSVIAIANEAVLKLKVISFEIYEIEKVLNLIGKAEILAELFVLFIAVERFS